MRMVYGLLLAQSRRCLDRVCTLAPPIYQQQSGWTVNRFNWNQVRNGGISIGALAVAEEEPEKSAAVLRRALKSIPLAMASYGPDGGWPEDHLVWCLRTGKVKRFERGVALVGRARVIVQDELSASQPVEALWGMVTQADVNLKGQEAWLAGAESGLPAQILSPQEATFEVVSTRPPPPQNPNQGTRKLVVRLPGKVSDLHLAVSLTPRGATQAGIAMALRATTNHENGPESGGKWV